jgi:hypothetical protein
VLSEQSRVCDVVFNWFRPGRVDVSVFGYFVVVTSPFKLMHRIQLYQFSHAPIADCLYAYSIITRTLFRCSRAQCVCKCIRSLVARIWYVYIHNIFLHIFAGLPYGFVSTPLECRLPTCTSPESRTFRSFSDQVGVASGSSISTFASWPILISSR